MHVCKIILTASPLSPLSPFDPGYPGGPMRRESYDLLRIISLDEIIMIYIPGSPGGPIKPLNLKKKNCEILIIIVTRRKLQSYGGPISPLSPFSPAGPCIPKVIVNLIKYDEYT